MSEDSISFIELIIPTSGRRLDSVLLNALKASGLTLSRARLKTFFAQGLVEAVRSDSPSPLRYAPVSPSDPVEPGTRIRIPRMAILAITNPQAARPSIRGCFLPIVYENSELLVLHKASGIPSLPHSSDETETAVGAALARDPGLPEGSSPLERGLLHRLDTGTSGLLAFARTAEAYTHFREQWRSGGVRKLYRALVRPRPGEPPPHAGIQLDWPLAHDASRDRRMVALLPGRHRVTRGKPLAARTHVLEAHALPDGEYDLTIEIFTGVMHQIRCHLAAGGWPILGDPIYGGQARASHPGVPSERLFWLHAWKLEIQLGWNQKLALEAELPEDWG